MVIYVMKIQFLFDGIKSVTVDKNNYDWCLKVKCTECGEPSPNWHTFTAQDSLPLKGGRGSANFIYKCKLCSRENSLEIVKDSIKKIKGESETYYPLAKFDCRGLEPTEFQAKGPWIAESDLSNMVFDDIDLSDDWIEYDDSAVANIGIYDAKAKFDRVY